MHAVGQRCIFFALAVGAVAAETLEAALESKSCYNPPNCTCSGSWHMESAGYTGTIPSALSACAGLDTMCVRRVVRFLAKLCVCFVMSVLICLFLLRPRLSKFSSNSLTGPIPPELGALTGFLTMFVVG